MKTSFLFTILFLFGVALYAQPLPKILRTDGVYIYDNGMHYLTYVSETDAEIIIKAGIAMGFKVDKHSRCIAPGRIPCIGKSSAIDFIAFSDKGWGTTFGQACRDTASWWSAKSRLVSRAQGPSASDPFYHMQLISNIQLQEKNEITFQQGPASPSNEFGQARIKVYKDSLVFYRIVPYDIRLKYRSTLALLPDSMCYRFYPYKGSVPPAFSGKLEVRKL